MKSAASKPRSLALPARAPPRALARIEIHGGGNRDVRARHFEAARPILFGARRRSNPDSPQDVILESARTLVRALIQDLYPDKEILNKPRERSPLDFSG